MTYLKQHKNNKEKIILLFVSPVLSEQCGERIEVPEGAFPFMHLTQYILEVFRHIDVAIFQFSFTV